MSGREVDSPAGEPGPGSQRAARLVLYVVAMLAMWGIVAALPEVAYVIVGVLGCLGWQKTAGWIRQRRGAQLEDAGQGSPHSGESVPETLHRLAGPHVFLADFGEARGLSKDAARAVLEALGMSVRRAVRNGERTGVGVHRDDLPPLPRPAVAAPVGGVDQGQPTNQQGVEVEPLGLAGVVLKHGREHGLQL